MMKDIVGSFKAFRGADGRWRWVTATTNKFKDREGEIFTEEAHKEAVQYATMSGHYPELRLWHTPGSCLGRGDFAEYVDGFVVHSGTFEPGREAVAAALSVAKGLAVSQGYKYRAVDRADKVYDWYRTFEVSILPASRAANVWTSVVVGRKEVAVPFSRDKKAFLAKYLGAGEVEELEKRLGLLSKQLEWEGVDFKQLDDCLDGVCSDDQALSFGEKQGQETGWKDSIYEDLDQLNPRTARHQRSPSHGPDCLGCSRGEKQQAAAEEFAEAMEDDPAGVYLADLARFGAVKG